MAIQMERLEGFEAQPLPSTPPAPHLEVITSPEIEYGHMGKSDSDQWVEVTEQNRHFFSQHNSRDNLELRYHHSASVVGSLQSNLEMQQLTKPRELAFFDKQGKFYDHVTLRSLELFTNGRQRHTAHFESYDESGQGEFSSLPAGDIYSLSLAYNKSAETAL